MSKPQLLIISDNRGRVERIRESLRALGSWDVVIQSSAELVRGPLGLMIADAVVIDLDGLLDRSMGETWVAECRNAFRPVPVVALRDSYDELEALACFRIGVSDFLSLEDHSDRLAHIISALAIESSAHLQDKGSHPQGIRRRNTFPTGASTRMR